MHIIVQEVLFMSDYFLLLILLTLCLGGVPLDAKIKQILYIVLAVLGIVAFVGGGIVKFG